MAAHLSEPCTACQGTGINPRRDYDPEGPCHACGGLGTRGAQLAQQQTRKDRPIWAHTALGRHYYEIERSKRLKEAKARQRARHGA